MSKKLLLILFVIGVLLSENGMAQCVTITCPGDTSVVADSSCSAIVSYSPPIVCAALDSTVFNYTGVIDTFFVPAGVTTLTIKAWGAKGGGNIGGLGAFIQGDIAVTPGDTLKILVGQEGLTNYGYGGGGGSFVATINDIPLLVAGGGGGAEHILSIAGYDALLTNDGMNVELALGGVAGGGGELGNPNTSGCGWSGSGGGGFYGDGSASGDGGGSSFINGGAGGIDPTLNCVIAGFGGFGGGGASGNAGGGGGGYSGGAGGANIGVVPNRGGGGGGSYNSGTNQVNTAGVPSTNGMIQLSYDATGPLYVTMIQGLGSGATFPIGVTIETYVVTDSISSSDTCSFTITVIDSMPPEIICPTSLTTCSAIVSGIEANAIDLCSASTIDYVFSGATTVSGTGDASGNVFNSGSTTVTYTATDGGGNSSSCVFDVNYSLLVITVSTSDTFVCVDDGLVTLTGTPVGGTWSGSGVSGSTFNPGAAGSGVQTLTYSYTDSSGCLGMDSLVITVDACAGLAESELATNWRAYPNPTNGLVNITFDSDYTNITIDITEANGRLVRTEKFNGQKTISLSLSDLVNGIYFLIIKADESEKIVKIIKD